MKDKEDAKAAAAKAADEENSRKKWGEQADKDAEAEADRK